MKKGINSNKRTFNRRRSKYNNKITFYKGHWYHSKMEAEYSAFLDRALAKKVVKVVERQVPVNLLGLGAKPIGSRMIVDFRITKNDEEKVFHEVKGFETDVFRLKHKIAKVQGVALKIIKRNKKEGWYVSD